MPLSDTPRTLPSTRRGSSQPSRHRLSYGDDIDEDVITVREGASANSGASYYYSDAHRMSTITAPTPIVVDAPVIPQRPAVLSPIMNYPHHDVVASRPPAVAALVMSEYDTHTEAQYKQSQHSTPARWKRWLIAAAVLIAVGVGVAVPVVLLTQSHSHNNAAATSTEPDTNSAGASQVTPTTPPLPQANDNQQIGELLFTFSGSSYGIGFNPNIYAFAHSAGTEQTVNYTITNTGSTALSNITVTVMLFPALQMYTVGDNFVYSPMPNSYPNNYANIPYTLTVGTIAAQTTITISTNGGWYQPPTGSSYYDVLWAMYYNSSAPMMNVTNESTASVTQTTRITGPVTAAPTTQPATPGPTVAPTPAPTHRPAPAGIPSGTNIYNPGALPAANWNETATQTIGISASALNVITQGGQNNYYRQHYYADSTMYITPASILATNSLNVQIAPAWSIDTTPLLTSGDAGTSEAIQPPTAVQTPAADLAELDHHGW